MRKLVVAICLDLFTECRCSNAWWVHEGRSQQEEKTVVKNSSGVLIKFYRGQKGYLLKDHGLAWGIETRYLPRTNAATVHLRGHTVLPSKIPDPWETVCSIWRGGQEQPDNVAEYKPRTKWCNNYAEDRQLINLFTPKTKERDIRKYGKPHLTKILFSAIWIHRPLILSNIL